MLKPIGIAAIFGMITAALATSGPADAGYVGYGVYYGCPAYFVYPPPYIVTDYGASTYYYGGFYGPRVAFAPRLHRTRYGYVVRYQNVPRRQSDQR